MQLKLSEKRGLYRQKQFLLRNKISQHTVNQRHAQPLSILAYLQAT